MVREIRWYLFVYNFVVREAHLKVVDVSFLFLYEFLVFGIVLKPGLCLYDTVVIFGDYLWFINCSNVFAKMKLVTEDCIAMSTRQSFSVVYVRLL